MVYEPRTYRHWVSSRGLISFSVVEKETDLLIMARENLGWEARMAVQGYRSQVEGYIKDYPSFGVTLEPVAVADGAPPIVKDMAAAAQAAGVGPMAAVAGAIAEFVGRELLQRSEEVIVENGGDIFLRIARKRSIGIYAGKSPLTGRIALEILPEETPLGICTSSGTVGHSLSFGWADAVIAISSSASLADAAATAIGNIVITADSIPGAIERAQQIAGLAGIVIIKDDKMGLWGQVRLVEV